MVKEAGIKRLSIGIIGLPDVDFLTESLHTSSLFFRQESLMDAGTMLIWFLKKIPLATSQC